MSSKRPLALVGFAPRSRDSAPYDDPNYDIWTINHAPHKEWMKRFDVLFDIHPLSHITRSVDRSPTDKLHLEWLKQEHDFPIYMMEKYPEFPASKRFPIEKLREKFGDFYTSSFAFLMAFAIYKGYKRIDVFGFDMAGESEYNYQRDSAEYFIGLAIGMGIDVGIPDNCTLLKGPVYALEDNNLGFKQQLELRHHGLIQQRNKYVNDYFVASGYVDEMLILQEEYPDLLPLLEESDSEAVRKMAVCNKIEGMIEDVAECMDMYDKYYNIQGSIRMSEIEVEAEAVNDEGEI